MRNTGKSPLWLEAVARGIQKVERRNRDLQAKCQEFNTEYGRQVGRSAFGPFAKAVSEHLAHDAGPRSQSHGRPDSFSRLAKGIPPGTIVLLTLQSVINGLSMERSLVSVADTIGTLLDESCRDGVAWTTEVRVRVGLKCIGLLEGSVPDLIHTPLVSKPGQGLKTERHIVPTGKTLAFIHGSPEKAGWAHPSFKPTLTIPDAYESTHTSTMVSRVVNAIQATPWTINRQVYEVALARQVEATDMRAASTMLLAKNYLDAEQFYFPAHLDFRGRVYASPTLLSFQSDDLGAALLTFPRSEGKRLGAEGLFWLRQHGPNLFGHGVDKVSRVGRNAWSRFFETEGDGHFSVHNNADNPLTNDFWTKTDKPWQFLAWCFEYSAALRHPEGPENFVSSLPVAIDGSCNGLQHLSAVMRDEVGGRLVNIGLAEDFEEPEDVYGAIADKIKNMMEREHDPIKKAYADEWLQWPNGLSRKAAKQIAMVVPYAAERYGATDKLIRDYLDEAPTCPWRTIHNKRLMGQYFTGLAFEAMGELVPSSLLLRNWLQEVSDALSKANLPIEWRAPVTGLAVVQQNYKFKTKTVEAKYLGKRFCPSLRIDSQTELSPKAQRSAITANFIHSLDAAHLVLTMSKLLDEGVSRFGCVHDSYVALASDMDLLSRLTREAFVELHQGNLMESFFVTACAGLPDEIRESLRASMPRQRGLSLEYVPEAPYLFS